MNRGHDYNAEWIYLSCSHSSRIGRRPLRGLTSFLPHTLFSKKMNGTETLSSELRSRLPLPFFRFCSMGTFLRQIWFMEPCQVLSKKNEQVNGVSLE